MALKWKNLDDAKTYKQLCQNADIKSVDNFNEHRILESKIPAGGGIDFHYGASLLSDSAIDKLQELAEEQQLLEKYQVLLDGEPVNTGENRMVLHHMTRGRIGACVEENGQDMEEFYEEQLRRIRNFTEKVHNQTIKGSTGKPFDTVVQIGIGGSDLGPRSLYLALREAYEPLMKVFFVSNVDPADATQIIHQINPETTLFILVSKSGTTQETLTNRDLIVSAMREKGISGYHPHNHIVAVTSRTSPLAESNTVLDSFYIDDYIGGRYSSTSAVGGVVLSLSLGPKVFKALLAGANEADQAALKKDIRKNAAMMDAMLGICFRNVLNMPCTAVLPYSQALSRFPAHLQQLDMESNGKSVNRRGEVLSYPTGPVVFGEPGTNGQHSFYQLLHQGTDIVPLQFIGFRKSQGERDIILDGSTSQTKLNANLAAQIAAFAKGSSHKNPNKNFDGGRPSTLLTAERLDARVLGALLAHFENKVMFQGFCWNVNSFDQEGVQLGKILTKSLLEGTEDESLNRYAQILGILK